MTLWYNVISALLYAFSYFELISSYLHSGLADTIHPVHYASRNLESNTSPKKGHEWSKGSGIIKQPTC